MFNSSCWLNLDVCRQSAQQGYTSSSVQAGYLCTFCVMTAAFLQQLTDLLHAQEPLLGNQFLEVERQQFRIALAHLKNREEAFTAQESTEVTGVIAAGKWTPEQKQALTQTVAECMTGPKQQKKGGQCTDSFLNYMTAADKEIFRDPASTLHTRLSHAADLAAKMELYWPSEPTAGHMIRTLAALNDSGLNTADSMLNAVRELKKMVKSRLKSAKPVNYIQKYPSKASDLPEGLRDKFTAVDEQDPGLTNASKKVVLRGSSKAVKQLVMPLPQQWLGGGQAMSMMHMMHQTQQWQQSMAGMRQPDLPQQGCPGLTIFKSNPSPAAVAEPASGMRQPDLPQQGCPGFTIVNRTSLRHASA